MSTYLMKEIRHSSELTAADYAPFVDGDGRLELQVEDLDPFAVSAGLRAAGFVRIHTWVDVRPRAGRHAVALRVTAHLP